MSAVDVEDLDTVDGWHPNGRNVVFDPVFGGRWTPEPLQADGSPYPTMGFAAAAWITAQCGLKLEPWQVEVLRRAFLYDPGSFDWLVEDIVIVGPEGIGKALDVQTPIATPEGWTTMGELAPGDEVFGSDGSPVRVLRTSGVMLGRPCYRVVFSDGASLVADAEHQWEVRLLGHPRENETAVMTTEQIAVSWQRDAERGWARYAVRVTAPIQLDPTPLPIPPYVLGYWLGDGDANSARVTVGEADTGHFLRQMSDEHVRVNEHASTGKSASTFLIGSTGKGRRDSLQSTLRRTGLLGAKHIPASYLRADEASRWALLQGLMDSDGYVSTAGVSEFCTTSEPLADDVYELLVGLGFKATSTKSAATLDGRPVGARWRLSFTAYDDEHVVRMPRKAARLRSAPDGRRRTKSRFVTGVDRVRSRPVRCIAVDAPDRLFLAGRDMIPTHNSAFFAGVGLWLLEGPCMPPVEDPKPHPRPLIPVVSAALSLTQHIHRHAKEFIERDGSPLLGRLLVENTKIFRATNEAHQLHFPAGSGAYQQGSEPVPAIIEEELHVMNMPGVKATGEETIKTISSKRIKNANPKVQRWTVTNPDDGDPNSLLGRRWRYATRVLDGELSDPSLLAIHYHAALPIDLDDPADLRRGVAEATPASWVDREGIARKYEKGEYGLGWTMRFSLGLFYAGDDQVLPDGALEARAAPEPLRVPPPSHVPVALAFDGARNRDSVSLSGCTVDLYGFQVDAWERPDGADDWLYPKEAIDDAVVAAMEVLWPTALLAVDPTWFEDFVYGWRAADGTERPGWARRWPDRVVVDIQKYGAQAWQQFRQAVIDGAYSWDGDPGLLRHMRNAKEIRKVRQGHEYVVLGKKRDDGKHPIDRLVTATYAVRLVLTALIDSEDADGLDEWRDALGVSPGDT